MHVINADGSSVAGFPIDLDQKVQRGVALADFNGNGKMDIVVGTDDEFIHLIHDDGTIVWSYETGGDIRVAPSILELNTGEKIILAGSKDDNFYALNSDGTLRFMIETDDDITTEASIIDIEGVGPVIFFASGSMGYAVEADGDHYIDLDDNGAEVSSSITFANVEGTDYAMFGDESGQAHMYRISDGESYSNFPISYSFPFKGSPTILDTDADGDLELLIGSTQNLVSIDIKAPGLNDGYWNTHRANMQRTGHYLSQGLLSATDSNINKEFLILNAYPNPFNPSINIDYNISQADFIDINIVDIKGNIIENLHSSFLSPGQYSVTWIASDISSGVYFVQIKTSNFIETKKMMLLK